MLKQIHLENTLQKDALQPVFPHREAQKVNNHGLLPYSH